MTASIRVLGPTRWLLADGDADRVRGDPLARRRWIARSLGSWGIPALVLEDHERRAGGAHFDLLLRTIAQNGVASFVLYWPLGARLHGLDVEIGYLLTRIRDERIEAQDVHLLVEARGLPATGPAGEVAWSEPGNRSRYHGDLVAAGCNVWDWTSEAGLAQRVRGVAMSFLVRRPTAVAEDESEGPPTEPS